MNDTGLKTTYHLVMDSESDFKPKFIKYSDFNILKLTIPIPEFNWFMYQQIGSNYRWGGRQKWREEEWRKHANGKNMETWGAYITGSPIGYYEIELTTDSTSRIHCIGLIERFIGKGLGSHLLSHAISQSWKIGAKKVILNTCSHDHPHALSNYLNRGFSIKDQSKSPANPKWKSNLSYFPS